MQAIKKKLSSRRGASITFALLLFLVCSVVGSVVLTAGTAAAGRMSKISEMDQRYYSVNSAAKLMIGLFERDEIRCEKTAGEDEAEGPEEPEAPEEPEEPEGEPDPMSVLKPSDSYTFTVIGKGETAVSTLTLDTAKRIVDKQFDSPVTLNLTLDGTELSDDELTVSITETILPTGDVSFLLANSTTDTAAVSQYAIRLTFMNVGTAGTFKWKLTDIESIRSQPAGNSEGA